MSIALPAAPPANSPAADCLTREEAAQYIRVSVATLASWSHTGRYRDILPFALLGKKAYYRRADLDQFLDERFGSQSR